MKRKVSGYRKKGRSKRNVSEDSTINERMKGKM